MSWLNKWLPTFFGSNTEPEVERARLVGPEEFASTFDSSGPSLLRCRSAMAWVTAALKSPIVRPIIERISTDVAMEEYFLTDIKAGKREKLTGENTPAEAFLADPWTSGAGGSLEQLLKLFVVWEKVTGNVIALKDFSPSGKLKGLIPIPTPYCGTVERIAITGTNIVDIWLHLTIPDTSNTVRVPLSDCFWHRNVNWADPNGPGSAIIECLNDEINQDEEAAKFNSAFFANGCTPHMIVSVLNSQMEQTQIDKLKAKWRKEYQGASNAFRALFVKGDLKVTPFQSSSKDAQVFEIRNFARDTCLAAFQMPPEIMGIKNGSGKTAVESADLFYRRQCIKPEMHSLCTSLNRQVFSKHFGRVRLQFCNPVREAAKDKLEKTMQAWTNGLIPRAKACHELGFEAPPEALAGHYMIPGNMFLVDDKGKVVMSTTTPTGTNAAPSPGGSTPGTTPPKLGNGKVNKQHGDIALERYYGNQTSLS